ncbi:MAG: hypothetical protein COW00_00580 [Bdellovibrio sp. CG12_big_fil_rev_8_21_14_0_65_39_13]|nr:MAG: hypothetical protein COW78_04520 [Bdellovibrio sp. CG22_combo_CG10-13_8_21_14_all_39_27]PIQ62978.1 MAG: hypothetical protein COW00_00580 [Bdellovibrio sp. CG12_big_fil_rev_8_21_14_0_65_39_13]PIR32653.1 MAG: hypothetical protein COV37_19070 [Bdellovibrio sp. CG11_big_fil_rev_8_21_14_0_20_39_38]PJB52638.1 MAG: hypothetical protein CO099_11535 [Bdellovibrio sp. CG_4_9_14_3_um_filter_39_7]
MVHVLAIHTSANDIHRDDEILFDQTKIRLTQLSVDFDYDLARELIIKFDGLCDAIALSGIPPVMKAGQNLFSHPWREKLLNTAEETPVLDGLVLKEIYMPWLLRKYFVNNPEWIRNKKIVFYSGALMQQVLDVVDDFTEDVTLADPYFLAKVPMLIKDTRDLGKWISRFWPVMRNVPIRRKGLGGFSDSILNLPTMRAVNDAQIYVANMATLELIDLKHLRGKKVILDVCNQKVLDMLKMHGVEEVLVLLPQMIDGVFVNFSILEGLLQATQVLNQTLSVDFVLSHMNNLKISPVVVRLDKVENWETQFHYL